METPKPQTQIIKEIEQEMGENIVVVNVIERSSDGYYNYKSRYVAIYVPPLRAPYEEQDILETKEIQVYCGVFQEIESCQDVIEELRKLDFTIIKR